MAKNEHVSMLVLEKICRVLDCNIEDVCEFVNDEEGAEK
jgi:DNA-binding Xre family transcriptional regulator